MCNPSPAVESKRIEVTNSHVDEDQILVLSIDPLDNRVLHCRKDGAVYLRQGDKSPKLDPEQFRALEYDKGQLYYESELEPRSSLSDVDHQVVQRYKDSLGTDLSDEQVLIARGFLRDGHLTRAGGMLFAEHPSIFYPLPRVIEGVKTMVSTLLREFQFLGPDGKFGTIPEYPEFAWFEGLVNAVTHRDYSFLETTYGFPCMTIGLVGTQLGHERVLRRFS